MLVANGILESAKTFLDDVLNKAIQAMRNQRDQDLKSKDCLAQEKSRLEACVNQLQGRIADLEAQVTFCFGCFMFKTKLKIVAAMNGG